MDEHGESSGSFNQRSNRGTFQADDQIAFPVSGHGAIFSFRGAFAD